jgi:hypothetical protein
MEGQYSFLEFGGDVVSQGFLLPRMDIYCLAAARRASASVGNRPVVSGQDVNGAPQIIE